MSDARSSSEAERFYAEQLAELRSGDAVDIDAVCEAHPQLEEELRRLHADWLSVRGVLDRLGLSGSISARLEAEFGSDVDPGVELESEDEDDSSEFTTEVLTRLAERKGAFGRYKLKAEVARGGQGAVLRVWDEDLRRNLAMKVILGKGDAEPSGTPHVDSRTLGRFLEEAQVTGQLDHPGIVPVHELGLDSEGRVYFTMKLVKGRTFKEIIDLVHAGDEEWTFTRALGALLKVCEAMAYAHAKGVIHRDLKPSNVMVGRFGEVYVMDWGLARVLGQADGKNIRIRPDETTSVSHIRSDRREHGETPDSPLITMDGDVVGTPAYMSPEQARGELESVGPLSDVYSVGAMLYELLTGRMPYVGPGVRINNYAVWSLVQAGPPERLERAAPHAPVEVSAICERAMEREAHERYPDMGALARDVRAYLEGRVVAAHRVGPVSELKKWVGRNRLAAALSMSLLLLSLFGTATVAWLQHRAGIRLSRSAYVSGIQAASASLGLAELENAGLRLEECPEPERGWEWRHLRMQTRPFMRQLETSAPARELAVSPDQRWLAASCTDDSLFLWDVAKDFRPRRVSDVPDGSVFFSADGKRVGVLNSKYREPDIISVVEGSNFATTARHSLPVERATSAAFRGDSGFFIATERQIVSWSPSDSQQLEIIARSDTDVDVELHRIGDSLVAVSRKAQVALKAPMGITSWGPAVGGPATTKELPSDTLITQGGSAEELFAIVRDGVPSLIEMMSESRIGVLPDLPYAPSFSYSDRRLIAPLRGTKRIVSLDLARASNPSFLLSATRQASVHLLDRYLAASADWRGKVMLWDLTAAPHRKDWFLCHGTVRLFDFLPGGREMVAVSNRGLVQALDAWTGEPRRAALLGVAISSAALSADGDRVVLAVSPERLIVMDLSTMEPLIDETYYDVPGSGPVVAPSAVLSPEGDLIAKTLSGFAQRHLPDPSCWLLISAKSGEVLAEGRHPPLDRALFNDEPRAIVFGRQDSTVVVGHNNGVVHVWNCDSMQLVRSIDLGQKRIRTLELSPDGRLLAVGLVNGISLVRMDDDAPPENLPGHDGYVADLAFWAGGNRLASIGFDGRLRLWDPTRGRPLLTLSLGEGSGGSVAVDSLGHRVAVGQRGTGVVLESQLQGPMFAQRRDYLERLDRVEPIVRRHMDSTFLWSDAHARLQEAEEGQDENTLAGLLAYRFQRSAGELNDESWDTLLESDNTGEAWQTAHRMARAAAVLSPASRTIRNTLGFALLRTGQPTQALQLLQANIDETDGAPGYADLILAALACCKLGDKNRAADLYENAATVLAEGGGDGGLTSQTERVRNCLGL